MHISRDLRSFIISTVIFLVYLNSYTNPLNLLMSSSVIRNSSNFFTSGSFSGSYGYSGSYGFSGSFGFSGLFGFLGDYYFYGDLGFIGDFSGYYTGFNGDLGLSYSVIATGNYCSFFKGED